MYLEAGVIIDRFYLFALYKYSTYMEDFFIYYPY